MSSSAGDDGVDGAMYLVRMRMMMVVVVYLLMRSRLMSVLVAVVVRMRSYLTFFCSSSSFSSYTSNFLFLVGSWIYISISASFFSLSSL